MGNLTLEKNANEKLARKLGLFDSTMIVMGIVIGGGIFYTTGIMAQSLLFGSSDPFGLDCMRPAQPLWSSDFMQS